MTSAGDRPPVSRVFQPVPLERFTDGDRAPAQDVLAVEDPLEIRIAFPGGTEQIERPISITMRTPGHDAELAAGFLFTEGILRSPDQILHIHTCRTGNMVRVHLRDGTNLDLARLERNFYTTSSCGVCGKASLEAVRVCVPHRVEEFRPTILPETLLSLPDKLRAAQAAFELTGGLHASGLFSPAGELLSCREDVGRHNALDKLIGRELLTGRFPFPLAESILLVSGRVSFELVQKAAMAGIPILAAVGAPSSLAIELAREMGMTVLGFVRQNRFNIYCGAQRIADTPAASSASPADLHHTPVASASASTRP